HDAGSVSADRIARLKHRRQFHPLAADETAFAVSGDYCRRPPPDLVPAGVHRGKAAWQTFQEIDAVEPGESQLARHVDPVLETVEQPSSPDHVIGIVQEIEIRIALEDC